MAVRVAQVMGACDHIRFKQAGSEFMASALEIDGPRSMSNRRHLSLSRKLFFSIR